jgi:hypothetical protein
VYVGDLSLGHTYTFYAQAVTDHTVLDEEGNELYTDQHWSYSAAVQFTPLDIRQNQVGVFPSNNGGNNGSNNFYTFDYTLNNGVDYVNEVVRGDALSYNEPICVDVDINDECIWEYPNPLTTDGLHDINYSNVDVITPVSYRGEVL